MQMSKSLRTGAALLLLSLAACMSAPDPEQQGAEMLAEARALYGQAQYASARDTILSMRTRYPMALEARRAAILLMDSIELQLAKGDTLKQEFYRRKLAHDKEQATRNDNERD